MEISVQIYDLFFICCTLLFKKMCMCSKVADLLVVIRRGGGGADGWAIQVLVKPLTDAYGTGSSHKAVGASVFVWCGLEGNLGPHQVAEQRPQY